MSLEPSGQSANTQVELYGWQVSPFTAKVRSYLTYKGIPFKDKVPSAFKLNGKIKKDVGQIIMPVVYNNGQAIQDSSNIIEAFETQTPKHNNVAPQDPCLQVINLILEMFADEWLPLSALHFRWNYSDNHPFIYNEFGKSALPFFPGFIQRKVAKTFGQKMSGYLPILGVEAHMQQPLEKNTHDILHALNEHLSKFRFLLGDKPSLADFAMYGPIYAHLDRDPYPKNLVAQYCHVKQWVNVLNSDFQQLDPQAKWANPDEVLLSLKPLLSIYSQCYLPLILQSIHAIETWFNDLPKAQQSNKTKVPKFLGKATLQLGNQSAKRLNLTYGYWMWSRIHQRYNELDQSSQATLTNLFTDIAVNDSDFKRLFTSPLPCKVSLNRCRLYLDN